MPWHASPSTTPRSRSIWATPSVPAPTAATCRIRAYRRRGRCDRASRSPDHLRRHRLPALQQRLEVAEDPQPAAALARSLQHTGDHRRVARRLLEVVDDAETAHTAFAFRDLIREARESLGVEVGIHRHAPGDDELARRIRLDDFTIDDDAGESHRGHALIGEAAVLAARTQVVLVSQPVAEALRPFRLGDRVPDRLR